VFCKMSHSGWGMFNTVLVKKYGELHPMSRMAAFDFDGCLVVKMFGDREMCSVMFDHVPDVLRSLYKAGYMVCIISNQGDIGRATNSREETVERVKRRFDTFVDMVGIPCLVLASTTNDKYRKPDVGMWLMVQEFCEPVIDSLRSGSFFDDSFYVGDAAGRPGDHSDCDKEFAKSCNISFYNELEFFRDRKYTKYIRDINEGNDDIPDLKKVVSFNIPEEKEVVLMVGCQASGKTTIANMLKEKGYMVIHGDDHKSDKKKMGKLMFTYIVSAKSVVIDATNPSVETRKHYLDLIPKCMKRRVFHVTTDQETCIKRNNLRDNPVPKIAFTMYSKFFVPPTVGEGFDEVVKF
jgi:bifunctional polynucleotide phosphatase/kinase